MKPSAKQLLFVKEYLIDLNAAAAYRRAGYKSKNPDVDGHKLLVKPKIQTMVQEAMAERSKRTEITADRVLQEYAKIGFANIGDYLKVNSREYISGYKTDGEPMYQWEQRIELFDTDDIGRDKLDAVSEIKETKEGVAFKLHDKKGALDSIARHLGMFNDKLEHSGSVQVDNKYSYMDAEARKAAIAKLQGMMKE